MNINMQIKMGKKTWLISFLMTTARREWVQVVSEDKVAAGGGMEDLRFNGVGKATTRPQGIWCSVTLLYWRWKLQQMAAPLEYRNLRCCSNASFNSFSMLPNPGGSRPVVPKLFRSTGPLGPYTDPQRPLSLKKCAFVSTFILYLKKCLNKIIWLKLNVLCVN
jgi:hypothetical protein